LRIFYRSEEFFANFRKNSWDVGVYIVSGISVVVAIPADASLYLVFTSLMFLLSLLLSTQQLSTFYGCEFLLLQLSLMLPLSLHAVAGLFYKHP
jgi:hypothetical protein